ncbi:MAG: ACT domain-containing protein, partial [Myxococcota bacterium]|nr:ACT domain-containing protein [Myxococcota bacterium]
ENRYAAALERAVPGLEKVANVDLQTGRSIICAVGEGMRERPGVVSTIFDAVRETGTNVEMISMGSSKINVTFVVRDTDAEQTLRGLHAKLIEQ